MLRAQINKDILKEIEMIAMANDGILDPYMVMGRALNHKSALSKFFDWKDSDSNNTKLMESQRLIQIVTCIAESSFYIPDEFRQII